MGASKVVMVTVAGMVSRLEGCVPQSWLVGCSNFMHWSEAVCVAAVVGIMFTSLQMGLGSGYVLCGGMHIGYC